MGITIEEIDEITNYINTIKDWQKVSPKSDKSRQVLQFGYSYGYGGNNKGIDKIADIPNLFSKLVLAERINNAINKHLIEIPMEQLIINQYLPGQGINFHTDHEKYFGPTILCLTIGSGTNIEFEHKDKTQSYNLYVEPGSLYIMTEDARYKWQHGIEQKIYDFDNNNVKKKREIRYSITFRTINNEYK